MLKKLFIMTALVMAGTATHAAVSASGPLVPSNAGDGTTLYSAVWSGENTTTYTSQQYTGLTATYTDGGGVVRNANLTFVKGNVVITSPNFPVDAGVYTVTATASVAGDTIDPATATRTLYILPATVSVEQSVVVITKFYDGNRSAAVTDIGTLSGVLGNDVLTHTVVANYENSQVGLNKTINVDYAISGADAANYQLKKNRLVVTNGAIIEQMLPDPTYGDEDGVNRGIEVAAYGYCSGNGTIQYHLLSGQPDQYRLYFDDPAFSDVFWTYLDTPGPDGTIDITIPAGVKSGDYTGRLVFRDHNCPSLTSAPISISFHVNLPETYVMPLFDDVIALIDTCHCLTDIQWFHRDAGETQWHAIDGANGFYYRQEGGLTGEYFVSCKVDGVATFTCPQADMTNLVSDNGQSKVSAYPNPAEGAVNVSIEGSSSSVHSLRLLNTAGVELLSRQFEGRSTTIDISLLQHGTYIVVVDGNVTRVIKK